LRKYIYSIVEGSRSGEPRFHLYIRAERRFSLRELYAKQHWAMAHLDGLPFNEYAVKLAMSREGSTQILILLEPSSSAFHMDVVTVKKETKTVEIHYDNILEFVFTEKEHIDPFLRLIQSEWRGEWIEDKEEE